jgi:hypothetical protein
MILARIERRNVAFRILAAREWKPNDPLARSVVPQVGRLLMVSLGLVRLLGLLYSAAVRELSAPAVVAESLNWG